MQYCQKCRSDRIANFLGHCRDCFNMRVQHEEKIIEYEGYVPRNMGIGGGDDIEMTICLDCGQIQGKFPVPIDKEILDFVKEQEEELEEQRKEECEEDDDE